MNYKVKQRQQERSYQYTIFKADTSNENDNQQHQI